MQSFSVFIWDRIIALHCSYKKFGNLDKCCRICIADAINSRSRTNNFSCASHLLQNDEISHQRGDNVILLECNRVVISSFNWSIFLIYPSTALTYRWLVLSRCFPWYLKVRFLNVHKGEQSRVKHGEDGEHPAEGEEQPRPRVGLRAHRARLMAEGAPRRPNWYFSIFGTFGYLPCERPFTCSSEKPKLGRLAGCVNRTF